MSSDEDPEVRNIGCQIVCSADVAGEVAELLREAVGEILEQFSDGEVYDYGVD